MSDLALPDVTRPAFFTGERLLPDTMDQAFALPLALHELHNRALHGHGIGFGLAVAARPGATSVTVSAGYAIDAAGHDLVLVADQELAVPPVSSSPRGEAVPFALVVSATATADAVVEVRGGVCGTSGAVGRSDDPTVRFCPPELVRDGLDVVLANVQVRNCRLSGAADLSGRRSLLPAGRPYVAGGATPADATAWRSWPESGAQLGVVTTVPTAEAGFGDTPRYQARVEVERLRGTVLIDGPVSIQSPTPVSFDVVVLLPQGFTMGAGVSLNPAFALTVLELQERQWRVVWLGVEGG